MAYTKLLLHCDSAGVPGYFVDSSVNNYTVTTAGDVVTDATQYKFGNYSGLFAGGQLTAEADYLSLADSADWDFDSGDFTIDFWFRVDNYDLGANINYFGQYVDANNYWWVTNGGIYPTFSAVSGGTALIQWYASHAPAVDTWYHYAIVRDGNTWYFFVDGVSKTVTFYGETDGTADMPDIAAVLTIGAANIAGSPRTLLGWIDEFRISKGIARWTSNFTPPTQAYTAFEEYTQSVTDTVIASDTLTKQAGYKRTFTETLTTSDNYLDVFGAIKSFLETVTLSDVLGKSAGRWKNLTDAMTLADVMDVIQGTGRGFVDAVTLSDTLSFIQTLKKNFSETMTLSDTLMKGITEDFSDTMTVSDLLELAKGFCRDFTEAITLSDTLQKAISMYGLSDAMTLTDLLSKAISKGFNETIVMSESFSKSAGLSQTFSDSISLVENPFTMTERGETVVDISKDPQVAAGEKHGELLTIHHITNLPKLQITNGRGVSLMGGGNYIMGSGDTLTLVYQTDNSIWQECNRGKYL